MEEQRQDCVLSPLVSGFTRQQCEFSPCSWPRRHGGRGGPGARALGATARSLHVALRVGKTHQPLDLSPSPRKMRLEDNDFCETSHGIQIWLRCKIGVVLGKEGHSSRGFPGSEIEISW